MILSSYVKKTQTISFVERGFERLGLGHQTVVCRGVHTELNRVRSRSLSPRGGLEGSGQSISSEESGELNALLILLVSRTPWLGGRVVPPLSHTASLILLYGHLSSYQRPCVSSIS